MEYFYSVKSKCRIIYFFAHKFALLSFALWFLLNLTMTYANADVDVDISSSGHDVLENAAILLQQKKAEPAYRLLEKHEDEYAGWWEYDYLLGVAALESGKANLAIFALQRSLAMNPKLMGAHMDLGRAYFEVNEFVPAKAEFETVLNHSDKEPVNQVARNYLQIIQNKVSPVRFLFRYYLSTVAGYDTNANSATESTTFGGYDLSSDNVKTASTYFSLKAGVNLHAKMDKKPG